MASPEDKNSPESEECKAYKHLESKLSKQCSSYSAFDSQEIFGSFPGMYEENKWKETIPSDLVSDYFRGGIISSMATFEAFIVDLLEEASKLLDADIQAKLKKLQKEKKNEKAQRPPSVLFHNWNSDYTRVLLSDEQEKIGATFTDYLFRSSHKHRSQSLPATPMKYTYGIQNDVYSELEIGNNQKGLSFENIISQRRQQRIRTRPDQINDRLEDESAICAMLRLFYGIRCIMAHGISAKTLSEGVLKDFPKCPKCQGNLTQIALEDSMDLAIYLDNCTKNIVDDKKEPDKKIKHERASTADHKIRRIPSKEKFEELREKFKDKLEDDEWTDVFKIIEMHFPTIVSSDKRPASFAYFHMARICMWLKKDKKKMYITYRNLVRINQFIHMLAFRIHIAVAEILIRKHGST